jgi:hypothetical protein
VRTATSGRGFYLTSNLNQACQWANTRVLPWQGPNQNKIAAVLEFEVDWDQLATRSDLAFVWEGAAPPPTTGCWWRTAGAAV